MGLGTGWGSLFIPVSALQLLHSGTGWDGRTLGWGLHKATTAKTGSRTECGKARVYTRAPLNWVGPLPAPGHSSILTICSCHQLVAPPPGACPLSSEANNNPRLLYPPFPSPFHTPTFRVTIGCFDLGEALTFACSSRFLVGSAARHSEGRDRPLHLSAGLSSCAVLLRSLCGQAPGLLSNLLAARRQPRRAAVRPVQSIRAAGYSVLRSASARNSRRPDCAFQSRLLVGNMSRAVAAAAAAATRERAAASAAARTRGQ